MGRGGVYVTHFFFSIRFSAVGKVGEKGRDGQEAGPRSLGTKKRGLPAYLSRVGGVRP